MTISFYKLRVGTNDFILIDGMKQPLPTENLRPLMARRMMDRRIGIGANGLILLSGKPKDIAIACYDQEGTSAASFDDALLCVSRYLFDCALIGREDFSIRTGETARKIEIIDSLHFRLSLGSPYSSLTHQALTGLPLAEASIIAEMAGNTIPVMPIHVRFNAAVMFWKDTLPRVTKLREPVRAHPALAEMDATAIVVKLISHEELEAQMARNENRDRTAAAAAALTAAVLNGFSGRYAHVRCDSSDYIVQWLEQDNELMVSGSAEYAFDGSYFWDEEAPWAAG
jgi:diaminopimelate epimerase